MKRTTDPTAKKKQAQPNANDVQESGEVKFSIPFKPRDDAYPPHKELADSPIYETMRSAALAATPAAVVAQVAASLPGQIRPIERVRTAYQLLDMATFVGEMLSDGKPTNCYNSALKYFELGSMSAIIMKTKLSPVFSRLHADYLPNGWQRIDSFELNKHRVPLDVVMGSIFGRSVPKTKRREKFDEYLEGQFPGEHDTSDWKEKGVPLIFFHEFWIAYPHWRSRATSEKRAKARAGKTEKPKKGRVKKSKDKRRGSRLEKKSLRAKKKI
jgi:hypothetical protein